MKVEDWKNLSKEEIEKKALALPRTPFQKYEEINLKVDLLIEFIDKIKRIPSKEFFSDKIKQLKEIGLNPAEFLKDYIVLEISKFYTASYKDPNFNFPEPPAYWDKIKDVRNDWIGHLDDEGKITSNYQIKEIIDKIDGEIEGGLDRVIEDFKNYYKKCKAISEGKIKV